MFNTLTSVRPGIQGPQTGRADKRDSEEVGFDNLLAERIGVRADTSRSTQKPESVANRTIKPDRIKLKDSNVSFKAKASEPELEAKESKNSSEIQRPQKTQIVKMKENNESEEVTDEELDPEVAKVQSENKKVQNVVQNQMLDFMASLESETGIKPERFVTALAELSSSDQALSPDQTAEKVIDQLDLDPDSKAQAMALYAGLIHQLKTNPVENSKTEAPIEKSVAPGAQRGSWENLQSTLETKGDQVHKSQMATQISEKFFAPQNIQNMNSENPAYQQNEVDSQETGMQASPFAETEVASASARPAESPADGVIPSRLDSASFAPERAGPAHRTLDVAQSMSNAGQAQSSRQEGRLDLKALQMQQLLKPESAPIVASDAKLNQNVMAQGLNMQPRQAVGENFLKSPALGFDTGLPVGAVAPSKAGGTWLQNEESEQDDASDSQGSESADLESLLGERPEFQRGAEGPANFKEALISQASTPSVSATERVAATQAIMNQTEILLSKGGGEARIQLNPVGLGSVQIQMHVRDGKVDLALKADSVEAKKLIEGSMDDLKSQLSTHRFSLETVKVDVSSNMSGDNPQKDLSQQQQKMDFSQNDRNQARDLFAQLQDNNSFGRGMWFDTSVTKAYGARNSPQAMQPVETKAVARYQGSGKGTGLDLVA